MDRHRLAENQYFAESLKMDMLGQIQLENAKPVKIQPNICYQFYFPAQETYIKEKHFEARKVTLNIVYLSKKRWKFRSKIEIWLKNRNSSKNRNFAQKSKFYSKIEILLKNRNSIKIEILLKNRNSSNIRV